MYAYFQEFAVPDSGERLTRKGFIGIGKLEDYSAGIVFRHEQTLTGPKKDRLDLLRHTRAHFGQLFMLYPDPEGEIDRLLDQSTQGRRSSTSSTTMARATACGPSPIRRASRGFRLDGRQKTADRRRPSSLRDCAGLSQRKSGRAVRDDDAGQHALARPRILATHRVLRNLENFNPVRFFESAVKAHWSVSAMRQSR